MPGAIPYPIISLLRPEWLIEAQWDGTTWNDLTPYVLEGWTIRQGEPREGGEFEAANVELVLRNSDGRFTADNTSSPLYPNVKAGVAFRIRSVFASVTKGQLYGSIERLEPTGGVGPQRVTLSAVDDTWRLEPARARGTDWAGKNVSVIFEKLADDAAWPATRRRIEVSPDCAAFFALDAGESVGAAMSRLVGGEGGQWYQDPDGNLIFEDRLYRRTASRCVNIQATIDDEFVQLVPEASIRRTSKGVRVSATPLVRGRRQEIWRYPDGSIELDPGQTKELWIDLDTQTTLEYVETPALNDPVIEWRASFVDGSGPAGSQAAGPYIYGGRTAYVSCTNTQATKRVRFYDIHFEGWPIAPLQAFTPDPEDISAPLVPRESTVSVEYKDPTVALGEFREIHHPYYTHELEATAHAKDQVDRVGRARRRPVVSLAGSNAVLLTHILERRIGDRVRIIGPKLDLDKEFWIESVELINPDDPHHAIRAVWGLAEVDAPVTVGSFGTGKFGSTRIVAY